MVVNNKTMEYYITILSSIKPFRIFCLQLDLVFFFFFKCLADHKLMILFLFSQIKLCLTFHVNCLLTYAYCDASLDRLQDMSISLLSVKNKKKNIINLSSVELAQSMLSVKY